MAKAIPTSHYTTFFAPVKRCAFSLSGAKCQLPRTLYGIKHILEYILRVQERSAIKIRLAIADHQTFSINLPKGV